MSASTLTPTDRTTVKRLPDRARFDADTVNAILDEGFVCHLGFTDREGRPVVIPTAYGRVGEVLYVHGSPASRMLRTLKGGIDVCVTVTLIDGLVMARSAFHHSINYRSVVVFGRAVEVADLDDKAAALQAFVDHVAPGRSADVRGADDKELRGTTVLALPIVEASAKVRTGPPIDEERDMAVPAWAGVLPIPPTPGRPIADAGLDPSIVVPGYLTHWRRG